MKNFWLGLLLMVGSIFIFFTVRYRPESLKSVRRSGSKYHVSPLGATSCGILCFAIGIAAVLHGLNMLSSDCLRLIHWLAIAQFGIVGLYDTYRNWKLGKKSPFYVGKNKK
jgi:UDP-N-acetylmuramyl pentapeptide phosphotransferase/UDP-N-acetylglucosamine-1-phosphate transferase